jgi:D-alanine-D-alanine ligase
MRVAVLLGGISAEREVSLISGAACAQALREEGFEVIEIDAHPDTLAVEIAKVVPDVVFNALHGDWGEDGEVQGLLEAAKIPYTHSGIAASRMAMDKDFAKSVFALHGITVAEGGTERREVIAEGGVLPVPYVVKPNGSGSSSSVYIVEEETPEQLERIGADKGLGEEPVIERYIPGRELTVSVMGGRSLCVTEIVPQTGWYDYDAKYADGGSVHIVGADIPDAVTELARDWAALAHVALGCLGVTRADFRFDDRNLPKNPTRADVVNKLVILEINTQPGMTPTSLVPEQCEAEGMGFGALCRWMVEEASWPRMAGVGALHGLAR